MMNLIPWLPGPPLVSYDNVIVLTESFKYSFPLERNSSLLTKENVGLSLDITFVYFIFDATWVINGHYLEYKHCSIGLAMYLLSFFLFLCTVIGYTDQQNCDADSQNCKNDRGGLSSCKK